MSSTKIGVNIAEAGIRQANAGTTESVQKNVGAFSREVDENGRGQAPVGHVASSRHAGAVEASPITNVAHGLVSACGTLQERLVQEGVDNPAYLGTGKGQWVYRNSATEEVCIQNLNVQGGLLGIADFRNVCTVNPDGHVFLNGEPVTMNHPDAPRIEQSLTKLLKQIAADELPRGSIIGGKHFTPPWEPMSPAYGNYAP